MIWLVLGVVSIVILYNSILKKINKRKNTNRSNKRIESDFLGRKKYFIEKNGKTVIY
jgi:hypothetical protein